MNKPGDAGASSQKVESSPTKTICIYISSVILVVTVLSSLSLLRFIISICHYEYTTGRTVCSPQNVVLERLPTEIPSRTLFLRVGGSEFYGSMEIFNASKGEDYEEMERESTIEHSFGTVESSNFSRFKNLRELNLFRCGIAQIGGNAFAELTKLRKLSLRNNRLTILQMGAFSGLTYLSLLDLSNNPLAILGGQLFMGSNIASLILSGVKDLSTIEDNAFDNATIKDLHVEAAGLLLLSSKSMAPLKLTMESLTLIHNKEKLSIEENAFKDFHGLKKLNLTNNSLNGVSFLRWADANVIVLDRSVFEVDGSFQFFGDGEDDVKTEHLSMSRCNLSKLPDELAKFYKHLKSLDLNGNKIDRISAENFGEFNELLHLDVSGNLVSSIDENISARMPNLVSLFLHSNRLSTMSSGLEKLFFKLQAVSVSDNPFQCNCNLKWFADWLSSFNASDEIMVDLKKANCSLPENINILKADNSIFLCHKPEIERNSFSEPAEGDMVILECSITGDPPPVVTWKCSMHKYDVDRLLVDEALPNLKNAPTKVTKEIDAKNISQATNYSALSGLYVVHSTLNVSVPGNFTCTGRNLIGTVNHTFDTNSLAINKKQFRLEEDKKVELLSSLEGAVVAAILLLIIGYLIKKDS